MDVKKWLTLIGFIMGGFVLYLAYLCYGWELVVILYCGLWANNISEYAKGMSDGKGEGNKNAK